MSRLAGGETAAVEKRDFLFCCEVKGFLAILSVPDNNSPICQKFPRKQEKKVMENKDLGRCLVEKQQVLLFFPS